MADSNVYPAATGLAKALAEKHKEAQPLKLYAGWFCPFVQRVWIALEEKRIPYEYIEVNPYHKPESLLSLNPRGLVPTLSVKLPNGSSKALYESTILLEYLEEAYPDNHPRLLPTDPYERARARVWIDYVTSRIIPAFHRFLQYQPSEKDQDGGAAGLQEVRKEFLNNLKQWTRGMDYNGPFFLGGEISLVDLALAPWAVRLWVFDEFKGGLGVPNVGEGGDDEDVWKRWRVWFNAVLSRKSVQETTSEREYYVPIYKRYADNVAQSELAKATRAGHGVP